MPSGGECIPALVLCFSGASRVGAVGRVDVACKLVVAVYTCVLVADYQSVGGSEATNDPEIFTAD